VQREVERLHQENEELRRKVTQRDKQISDQQKQISDHGKQISDLERIPMRYDLDTTGKTLTVVEGAFLRFLSPGVHQEFHGPGR
jgi:uncharacterized protein (DUF3084 family)